MVHSLLKPTLLYDEEQILMEQDIGIDVDVYELEVYHKIIHVVIGKENKNNMHRGVLSYSIYAIIKNKIKSRLGIIEIPTKLYVVYDVKNKTPDFSLYTPLFFTFVNSLYIDKLNPKLIDINETDEREEDDEIFNIDKTEDKQTDKNELNRGEPIDLFTKVSYKKIILQEESEITSKSIRKNYVEDNEHNWIQKFMKNPNYEIEYNSGNGDCFFYVIIQAFNQIGKETSVNKLRNLLSKEITKDIYEENKKLYNDIKENEKVLILKIKEEKDKLKKAKVFLDNIGIEVKALNSQELKEEFVKKNKNDINKYTNIKDESEKKIKLFNEELKEDKDTEDLIDSQIKKINSFDEYKEYIKTSNYWVDTWGISILEWLLDIKFIILNSSKYPGSVYEILECGEINKNIHETFKPKYYIITTYNGQHYELVMYKNKGIFEYIELPYDLKILIINKCMEKNSGIFNKINEFRDFQTRIGIDPNKNNNIEINENYEGLYDNNILFMFYNKSSLTPKPGKGSGEKIPIDKIKKYIPLSKHSDWRRKLDDSWMDIDDPIIIDNKKWASVSHYLWAIPFKTNFNDKYIIYSLNSNNKISKSYELAKKNHLIDQEHIHEDFMIKEYTNEREKALRVKFTKPEFKSILLSTENATLLHFENKTSPKEDKLLMFIRKELIKL
jgi:hypothetical protein